MPCVCNVANNCDHGESILVSGPHSKKTQHAMRLHVRICIIPATSICTELRELRRSNVTNNKAGGRMWAFGYDLWKAKRGKWESSSYTSLLSRSCGEKFGHSSVLDSMLLRFWFSMSRNKKKVLRGLSNPRMRCKDFSLCELLKVSI